ncbi:AraC-like DNA-binding protein [Mesorhizobium sangaii]|uniref:AraC-like DNA-binding protein n=2 Tax=Mesorhizobium sangaii TaxID=505389 RepID=A0A841PGN7_9HYPH|nr:AraC-like DNA-binding protein [Mesorhizobium sangaii]
MSRQMPHRPPSEIYADMADILERHLPQDGDLASAVAGLYLSRRSAPTEPVYLSQWPCFAFVIRGRKSVTLGDVTHSYGVGDYLVVSFDLPVVSRVVEAAAGEPHLGFGMAINPDCVRELLARMQPLPTSKSTFGLTVNDASQELLDASVRYLRLLDSPADISVLAPVIEREIHFRLLTGPMGGRLLQIAMAGTPDNRIARAIEWLRGNFAQPLRIEELARRVGMSVSSLHHLFKSATAMTPMQYQKRLRLTEARRLMLAERLDVGAAGYAVGYQSPSQFSREYRRLFGKPPIRDIPN